MKVLIEARKSLVSFTQYHRVQDGSVVRCMHCGNVWTGELHGHRRLYRSDPKEPPIHKDGCPVLEASKVIKSIDAALKKAATPQSDELRKVAKIFIEAPGDANFDLLANELESFK